MKDTTNMVTANSAVVTAEARTFPLIDLADLSARTDDVLALQIDALTPYVDLARMARERYDSSPSLQNGSRMGEKVGVLKTRITNILKAIPMRESELWTLVRQKFPKIDEILGGLRTNG